VLQPVPARVDEDPVEPLLEAGWISQGRPLPPGLDEGVVRGVLRLGGVSQDRSGEAVRGVEMIICQAKKGRPAIHRPVDLDRPAVCHVDDLG